MSTASCTFWAVAVPEQYYKILNFEFVKIQLQLVRITIQDRFGSSSSHAWVNFGLPGSRISIASHRRRHPSWQLFFFFFFFYPA